MLCPIIYNWYKRIRTTGLSMYIMRISNTNNFTISKTCKDLSNTLPSICWYFYLFLCSFMKDWYLTLFRDQVGNFGHLRLSVQRLQMDWRHRVVLVRLAGQERDRDAGTVTSCLFIWSLCSLFDIILTIKDKENVKEQGHGGNYHIFKQ